MIDENAALIGVPAGQCTLPPSQAPGAKYFFVTVRPGCAAAAASAGKRQLPFEGLRLGPQLGKGERQNPVSFLVKM
jgi:hypothetical protein